MEFEKIKNLQLREKEVIFIRYLFMLLIGDWIIS